MTTKIPAELSSTPGIVDGSNATAITIDSSERIGIGITSPSNNIHILGNNSTPNAGITIQTDDTASAQAGITLMSRNSSNTNVTATLKNITTALQSSLGITFGSDTAAANALDDYEEGTWTPSVTTGTVSAQSGSSEYTKIGDMVFAQTRLYNFSDTTSATAQIVLGGLPYSVGTAQSHIGTAWGNFGESIDRTTIFFYESGGAYYGGNNYGHTYHVSLDAGSNLLVSLIYRHG